MAADAPWTKVFHDEALQGAAAANLSAEEFGVYWTILLLIASRGAPIEDDRQWLARRCNISTRRLNQIIARLTAIPNKLVVRHGMIGNHKMLGVVRERDRKSDQARRAAHARWHGDDPELPLEDPAGSEKSDFSPTFSREKPAEKSEINRVKNKRKPQESATPVDADASPLRASARVRGSELRESNERTNGKDGGVVFPLDASLARSVGSRDDPEGRESDPVDLLLDACAEAAGFVPSAEHRARERGIVRKWQELGLDFEATVLPAIREVVSASIDPTSSLARFDRRLRHEKARAAKPAGDASPGPPAEPVLERDGEPPEVRPFREALLAALGPAAYVRLANKVRLEVVTERNVVRIGDPRVPYLTDDGRLALVNRCAIECGFKGVW